MKRLAIAATALSLALLLAGLTDAQAAEASPFKVLKLATPAYPPSELKAGHAGTARIQVEIGPDGKLVSASVHKSSGWPKLDASALEAVKAGTYEAGVGADGVAVASSGVIPITFSSPVESPESKRAYLERYLASPCAKFLQALEVERAKEGPKEGHELYAFRWPLLLMEELLQAEGKARDARRLMARDRAVYRNWFDHCTQHPASTTYTEFVRAVDEAL